MDKKHQETIEDLMKEEGETESNLKVEIREARGKSKAIWWVLGSVIVTLILVGGGYGFLVKCHILLAAFFISHLFIDLLVSFASFPLFQRQFFCGCFHGFGSCKRLRKLACHYGHCFLPVSN